MCANLSFPEEFSIAPRQIVGLTPHPIKIAGFMRQTQKAVDVAKRSLEIVNQVFISQDVHSPARLLQSCEIINAFEKAAEGIGRARIKSAVPCKPLKKVIHLLAGQVFDLLEREAAYFFGQRGHIAGQIIQIGYEHIQRIAVDMDDLVRQEILTTIMDEGYLVVGFVEAPCPAVVLPWYMANSQAHMGICHVVGQYPATGRYLKNPDHDRAQPGVAAFRKGIEPDKLIASRMAGRGD